MADDDLFAVQGWLPEENYAVLDEQLAQQSIPVVLEKIEPDEDEQPPTLIRPPAWARPIEGLFKMLGTVPGYREFDVSGPFLIALPIFTAMLISDAGYGAMLLLGPALAYPRAARSFRRPLHAVADDRRRRLGHLGRADQCVLRFPVASRHADSHRADR